MKQCLLPLKGNGEHQRPIGTKKKPTENKNGTRQEQQVKVKWIATNGVCQKSRSCTYLHHLVYLTWHVVALHCAEQSQLYSCITPQIVVPQISTSLHPHWYVLCEDSRAQDHALIPSRCSERTCRTLSSHHGLL